ncbi:MAG: metal-sulfur cluster assembly factor [Verrucomicrobiales bacterium]|nr:metal-sulfur cluster assembly factor [Verrucomicrobiales bacterium]
MTPPLVPTPGPASDAPSPIERRAWEALHHVIDPELGVNLVDLGLIYSIEVADHRVRVIMTVTTPGCPMEQSLTFGVETALLSVDGVQGVEVEVVYDPPWNPGMMTETGRQAAGIR